jgi:hypothetical protein
MRGNNNEGALIVGHRLNDVSLAGSVWHRQAGR